MRGEVVGERVDDFGWCIPCATTNYASRRELSPLQVLFAGRLQSYLETAGIVREIQDARRSADIVFAIFGVATEEPVPQ